MARKPSTFDTHEIDGTDEQDSSDEPSRSARKRAVQDLTKLGEDLLALRPAQLAALTLPERLEEALAEARRLTSFGAQRRQALFIGKLMRNLDEESLAAIRKVVERK